MYARAVLFDADGVLIDACDIHFMAFQSALAECGISMSYEEHQAYFNGRPTSVKLQLLAVHHDLSPEVQQAIARRKQEITHELFASELTVDQTKIELLSALRVQGYSFAVVSNSLRSSLEVMLDKTALLPLIDLYLGNDQARPKPAPDLYLQAAEQMGISIEECVIVEDSDIGLIAAHAAHPRCVIRVANPTVVTVGLIPVIENCFYG